MNSRWMALVGMVVTLLVGFAVGWTMESRRTMEAAAAVPAASERSRLPAPVSSPDPAVASRPVATPSATQAKADVIRQMLALQKKGRMNFFVQVMTPDDKLSAGIKELLPVSESEARILDGGLARARQQLKALEDASGSAVIDPATGDLVIQFPPFPEEGGKVYDELMALLQSTLGPERMAVLQELAPNQLDQRFESFGLRTKSITLTRSKIGNYDGYKTSTKTSLTSGVVNGRPVESYSSTSGGQFVNRASLVKWLGTSSRFLPPEY
ncbi:MAG TPA: hypothetical protein PLU52_12360 [Opitutaceae bacterium]|nr:hypothetical protein [Opitutaceae bacterium]HND62750.1 hypothetical protein [Opitutaceae bacterium]